MVFWLSGLRSKRQDDMSKVTMEERDDAARLG